ncbi:hypothetical protein GQ43DRAFT_444535 [Delitschia confertaspora ATCC 74209]|uniref:Uncharacterized protein n=1 Tax=Delitschia confertaspora ATCC 74209 TaxID=1513339 RepID=A0A9P4MRL1_9PLEO|nr:hypothetical protein GQ43DRAFT_444535 [Delitschia confertaspora ATCC 74209]
MSLGRVSRQSASPAANLLRNSRLFSLPSPLPKPSPSADTGSSTQGVSDTATLPYPTHQAIATTLSSLSRGDWGLKRNLPLKSTANTSKPAIRFSAIDTIEQITDFESAQDHVRTVEKWEELNVPMLTHSIPQDATALKPRSAFERDLDITAGSDERTVDERTLLFQALKQRVRHTRSSKNVTNENGYEPLPVKAATRRTNGTRWKFEGPWIPTMTASEFTRYVEKSVSERQTEFHAYVVEYVKHKLYNTRAATERAQQDWPEDAEEARQLEDKLKVEWSKFDEKDIAATIQNLRKESLSDPINSELLQKLIIPFLGLPPIALKSTAYNVHTDREFELQTSARTTHPSGGLGYLRTNAYLENHPILGPQASHTPVPARVVRPRRLPNSSTKMAKLGVAGVVTNQPPTARGGTGATAVLQELNLDAPGGHKIWVDPKAGSVTRDGRISLDLQFADQVAVAVKKGETEEKIPVRERSGGYGGYEGRRGGRVRGFSDREMREVAPQLLDALNPGWKKVDFGKKDV